MARRKEPWYRNPFYLGASGLVVLLAGYLLLAKQAGGGMASPLAVGAHFTFVAGVVIVLAAGFIWFLDARRPEPEPEDEDETTPDEEEWPDGD